MPPSPTPTDEDVNDVREVTGEVSRSAIATLIDNLNDAEWGRALDLVTAWHGIEPGDLLTLEGGREGVRLSDAEGLDDIRRRMRLLLGLPEFRDGSITGAVGTTSVPVLWVF
jgi:hypothetical protein